MRSHALWALLLLAATAASAAEPASSRRRRPPPAEYGRVVIAGGSEAARIAPVVFDHWVHRARYTCRLCHVDVGFAMKGGATGITAADNMCEEAERSAFTKPVDFVEGISLRAERLGIDRNFSISVAGTWLGEVAFSHQKHARWSGCEGCHPEVFPSTSRGAKAFRMKDVAAGDFCGVCHDKVAFPIAACLQCHETPR